MFATMTSNYLFIPSKKIGIFLMLFVALFLFSTSQAQAQVSMSIAGRYQKFIGGEDRFPFGKVEDFPPFAGAELRLNIGLSYKTALTLEGSYMMGTKRGEFTYANMITTKNIAAELSANLRYYLFGAYNDRGGFYTYGGMSGGMYNIDWTLNDYERQNGTVAFPEPEYFQDKQFWLLSVNAGLGAEVYTGSFYIFAEGGGSYRFKDYISNVTTYTPQLHHYWKANVGVRIPFGGGPQ
ncbi:hypothetical protein Fleli_0552 [Bernardetia litoralis DSM 6794]|uniref:Outer membrane protein beta-barrel domain-containing protein n=2 Tax=Bernardetia litoralis TaxID=999 RepID=I4AGD4_BERLS|nr:hypothetical protein Fleli_0552 [Bernardetia litoralis DSM 6794]